MPCNPIQAYLDGEHDTSTDEPTPSSDVLFSTALSVVAGSGSSPAPVAGLASAAAAAAPASSSDAAEDAAASCASAEDAVDSSASSSAAPASAAAADAASVEDAVDSAASSAAPASAAAAAGDEGASRTAVRNIHKTGLPVSISTELSKLLFLGPGVTGNPLSIPHRVLINNNEQGARVLTPRNRPEELAAKLDELYGNAALGASPAFSPTVHEKRDADDDDDASSSDVPLAILNDQDPTDDGSSGREQERSPTELRAHPSSSLKVGQTLNGKLMSPDEKSAVFPSIVDGSLVFSTVVETVPAGGAEGPSQSPTTAVLIAADPKKVKKVLQLRADVLNEEDSDNRVIQTGKLARLMRFMPFGKVGFRQRRARRHVKANLGDRSISITSRGFVVSGVGCAQRLVHLLFS